VSPVVSHRSPGPRRLCYTRCYTGEQPRHQPQTSMSRPASDGKPPVPSWHWVRRVLDRRLVTDGNSSAVVRHARSAAGRLLGRDPISARLAPGPFRHRVGEGVVSLGMLAGRRQAGLPVRFCGEPFCVMTGSRSTPAAGPGRAAALGVPAPAGSCSGEAPARQLSGGPRREAVASDRRAS